MSSLLFSTLFLSTFGLTKAYFTYSPSPSASVSYIPATPVASPAFTYSNIPSGINGTATASSTSPTGTSSCKHIQYPFPAGTNANDSRANAVKDAYVRSWDAYAKYAFGKDQLSPLNGSYINDWNGWGVTLVDAIDTAIVMNLTDIVTSQLAYIPTIDFT